jgi:nitrous oxidase accessory protein NosD
MADNIFEGNLTHVAQAGRNTNSLNQWRGNHWDDYQGFDRDGDGVGDTPYELYSYADQHLDGDAAGALLQDLAGPGTARFPRAPGALLLARPDAA